MLQHTENTADKAIILIHCPDEKGIISTVTSFIHDNNGNIINLDQYVDTANKVLFMRVEWELSDFIIPKDKLADYFKTLIGERYSMKFSLYFSSQIPRMAIFVSKMPHALDDLLARTHSGEWNVEIPLIISNHANLENVAKSFDIDFYHLPITKENKDEQEAKQLELLKNYNIDFIVLARYMQILTDKIIQAYPSKIINIHHSFLPAFPGAKPYHSAHKRGVKIIGATSHYVTEELDAGPIIDQGVSRVTHKEGVKDLIRKGKDLEKLVLSKAVRYHIDRRVLAFNNRTVVFE